MKNRRIVVTRPGGPDVLQLVEEDLPEPTVDQVRVRILAAGVAYADIGVRLGTYLVAGVSSGRVSPGYDIVGLVDKAGAAVTGWHPGQGVAALTVTGGYAEYVCLPASELVAVPEGVDPAQAVSLVLNYTTAYQMLHRVAEVQAGEWILAHGAAGGVGTALLQLGKLAGARAIGTASAKKQELVSQLGAIPINYQTEDFVARVREITGEGVHAAFDLIGGENIARSFDALRPGGILVTYGNYAANRGGRTNSEAAAKTAEVREELRRRAEEEHEGSKHLAGYFIARFKAEHPDWFRTDLETLFRLLVEKKIEPVIAERIPLAEARRAHELLDKAAVSGKIVLVV